MQPNDKMDPEDTRNLIIFAVLAIFLYFGYDAIFLKPHAEAMKQHRAQTAQQQQLRALETAKGNDPASRIKARDDVLERSDATRIVFRNEHIHGTIALEGGRIDDLTFYDYYETLAKEKEVALLSPRGSTHPRIVEHGWVPADKNIKVPGAKTRWAVAGNEELSPGNPVTLSWNNGQGLRFTREIALDEHYVFTITQRVANNSGAEVTLYPYGLISQTGLPADLQNIWIMHEGPMGYIGEELIELKYKDMQKTPQTTKHAATGWTAIGDKYWFTALIPAQGVQTKFSYNYRPDAVLPERGRYQTDFLGAGVKVPAGETATAQSHLYAGAKKVILLNDYKESLNAPFLDLAVDFGIFWFMTKPFFYILHWLGENLGNMGLAILALTFLIRMSVFPLTNTSYRSFAKMKKVAPQIAGMREQYGEDKQKLQQELISLYQREGVNPMAGCFPILLQIPIFFALYKILFITIEIRHAPFAGWIQDLSAPDPTNIFNLFGLLPFEVWSFLQIGAWPCMMLLVMIVQKKLNPPPTDQLQRDIANWFPFIITFVLAQFAAGLVIYWTFSAFLSVLQQMFIMRSLGVPIHLFGETAEEKEIDKAVSEGPAVHPLAEMAEDEVEEALFGAGDDDKPTPPIKPPKPRKSKKKKK